MKYCKCESGHFYRSLNIALGNLTLFSIMSNVSIPFLPSLIMKTQWPNGYFGTGLLKILHEVSFRRRMYEKIINVFTVIVYDVAQAQCYKGRYVTIIGTQRAQTRLGCCLILCISLGYNPNSQRLNFRDNCNIVSSSVKHYVSMLSAR